LQQDEPPHDDLDSSTPEAQAARDENQAPGPSTSRPAQEPVSTPSGPVHVEREPIAQSNAPKPTSPEKPAAQVGPIPELTGPLHRPGKEPMAMDIDEGPVNAEAAWNHQPTSGALLMNGPRFTGHHDLPQAGVQAVRPVSDLAAKNIDDSARVPPKRDNLATEPRHQVLEHSHAGRSGAFHTETCPVDYEPPARVAPPLGQVHQPLQPLKLPPNSGPVDVDKIPGGFDAFYQHWAAADEFAYELHITAQQKSNSEGGPWEVEGLAVSWGGSPVFYVPLARAPKARTTDNSLEVSKTLESCGGEQQAGDRRRGAVEERWAKIRGVFENRGVCKMSWDVKEQLLALGNAVVVVGKEAANSPVKDTVRGPLGELWAKQPKSKQWLKMKPICPADPLLDVRLAYWMLQPDKESTRRVSVASRIGVPWFCPSRNLIEKVSEHLFLVLVWY
jgi:hypothetical protein